MDLFNKKPVYAPMIASRAAGSRFGFFADRMPKDEPALKLVGTKALASTTVPQYELINEVTSPDNIIAVTHLDELIGTYSYSLLPNDAEIGFIKYKIKTHTYPSGMIVNAFCVKNGNRLSQSAMYINGTLSVGSVTKVISRNNDDNDATFMVMDAPQPLGGSAGGKPIGYGFQGDGNYNYWRSDNTYGRFRQTSTNNTSGYDGGRTGTAWLGQCAGVLSYTTSNIGGILIPFCRTGYNLGINWTTLKYQLGAGSVLDLPSGTSDEVTFRNTFTGLTYSYNSAHVIVDGFNSFVIMRDTYSSAANNVFYVKLDLENRTIASIELIRTTTLPGFGRESNLTEEDLNGNILHSVNGRPSYFSNGSWWHTHIGNSPTTYPGYVYNMEIGSMAAQSAWNTWPTHSDGVQATNTQTGMDIIVSTREGYPVYLGDHGHDNGGLFGVGNDTGVGTAPMNNLLIDYTTT